MENRDFGAKIRTKFSVSGPRENSGLYKNTANGDLLENVRSDRENVGLLIKIPRIDTNEVGEYFRAAANEKKTLLTYPDLFRNRRVYWLIDNCSA